MQQGLWTGVRFCGAVGADIENIRKGIGSDSRIGMSFLYAGLGYGGSCFPKDVKALINTFREQIGPAHILKAVEAVNTKQKSKIIEMVRIILEKIFPSREYMVNSGIMGFAWPRIAIPYKSAFSRKNRQLFVWKMNK